MDPVTHAATGLLAAQAAQSLMPGARFLLPACVLAAVLPDLDNFAGSGDPEKYLLYHRALSHSLLMAPVLAGLLLGIWRLLSPGLPLGRAFALLLALILGHLWLDYVTSYGTQLLAPLSDRRFTLEAVFIIDPVFTAGLLLAGLAAWRLPGARQTLALAALAGALLYPLASWGLRQALETRLEQTLRREDRPFQSLRLSPEAFSPWCWKAVVDRGQTYELSLARTLDPARLPQGQVFAKASREQMEALGRQAGIFATYEWFSLYPAVRRSQEEGLDLLTFLDLRFVSVHPLVHSLLGAEREPFFTLTAVLAPDSGRLLEYRYRRQGDVLRVPVGG